MHAVRLLEHALTKGAKSVLDIGVGTAHHATAFICAGAEVTGIDLQKSRLENESYTHIQDMFETHDFEDQKFDLIWASHILEHMGNVQLALAQMSKHLKDDGWLYIAVPTDLQHRFHIGRLTLWTPAHLVYNLICAGWDCKEAKWYSEFATIGLCLKKRPTISLAWRSTGPGEQDELNKYTPITVRHEDGAWWGNNWHEKTGDRNPDPPCVTMGVIHSNVPPAVQLAYGPNPNLRKPPGTGIEE